MKKVMCARGDREAGTGHVGMEGLYVGKSLKESLTEVYLS
jgi:hypothetical protein